MTYHEAKAFGIPYPTPKGWLALYGRLEVTKKIAAQLVAVNAARKQRKTKRRNTVYCDPGIRAAEIAAKQAAWIPQNQDDKFLQSYEWRRVRLMALKASNGRCQACGASPKEGADVDHIKPRQLFPALALDQNNLQVLCAECNHGKGNWDMTDWRMHGCVADGSKR